MNLFDRSIAKKSRPLSFFPPFSRITTEMASKKEEKDALDYLHNQMRT